MNEQPKREWATPQEGPCPICGNRQYSWGIAITSNTPPDKFLYFRHHEFTHDDGDLVLSARKCDVCGNVQFFYDT